MAGLLAVAPAILIVMHQMGFGCQKVLHLSVLSL